MCGQSQASAGEIISIEGLTIVWYTLIELCTLGNVYIAAELDLNLKAIFKNNDELWNNGLWLCIRTTPNKILQYAAIFTENMSKLSFRLFELFTIKSVKRFFLTPSITNIERLPQKCL